MLNEVDVQKFQDLYRTAFGRDIPREVALEEGIKLVRLMQIIYQPMTQDEYNKVQERREETKLK